MATTYSTPLLIGKGVTEDEVREIVTRPENFYFVTGLDDLEDYTPDPTAIYFRVGSGLVFYVPRDENVVELFTAVKGDDLPENPITGLHEQWAILSAVGYFKVYCFAQHHRARLMCRAAGMNLFKDNCFEKVIYGEWRR